MMIYEDKTFEQLILSQVDRKYFIGEVSMYSKEYWKDLKSYNLTPFLKRGVLK